MVYSRRRPLTIHRDVVVEIPAHIWDVLILHRGEFPYKNRDSVGHPWVLTGWHGKHLDQRSVRGGLHLVWCDFKRSSKNESIESFADSLIASEHESGEQIRESEFCQVAAKVTSLVFSIITI